MRLAVILLSIVLATGCVLTESESTDTGQRDQTGGLMSPAASFRQSPWVDADASINSVQRLVTPSGIDIRQARYILTDDGQVSLSNEPVILLRLRDYSRRQENNPDVQYLYELDPLTGGSVKINLPESTAPVNIVVNADGSTWALNTVEVLENSIARSLAGMLVATSGGEPVTLAATVPLCAQGFSSLDVVVARPVKRIRLDGGLPVLEYDWASPRQACNILLGEWEADAGNVFITDANGLRCAGYRIDHEPALPAASLISYRLLDRLGGGGTELPLGTAPYHVTHSAVAWEPPLCWLDEATLATINFLPDATGRSERANYHGLFRLVTINTRSGELRLVEDHLSAGLPVVAGGGVVFYTRQVQAAEETSWELWASTADGLRKQRLGVATGDTVLMSVEDIWRGRRLLVHRQYIATVNGEPLLLSELKEYGLDELTVGNAVDLGMQPLVPFEQAGTQDPLTRFSMDESGGRPPPISMPE